MIEDIYRDLLASYLTETPLKVSKSTQYALANNYSWVLTKLYKSHLNLNHVNYKNYIPHALCNLIFTVFLFTRYLKLFQSKNMSFCHFNTLLFVPFLQQGKLTPTFLLDFWPANGHICISGFLIWTVTQQKYFMRYEWSHWNFM